MLSRHPERCRFPHGHTRTIEVVVSGKQLDENDMLLDFKALKLALTEYFDRYDHAMAINSTDPLLPTLVAMYPENAVVVFDNAEPTTEKMAEDLYRFTEHVLAQGFTSGPYVIRPGQVQLDRVRVWETPQSWAEYSA